MKLPLLDYTTQLLEETNLENVLLIGVQHLLETNLTMFEYLFSLGLKPQNTFLLGKCYSTNKKVLNKFCKKGVYIHKGSLEFDSLVAFDIQFESEVKDFINLVQEKVDFKNYEKVLLVDDGGCLISIGNFLIKNTSNIVAIEQTSSGYNKLKNLKLKFPVINVARSSAKLNYESPFIASLIVEKLFVKLEKLNLSPKTVLIVGSGPIGKEIFSLLKKKFKAFIYDIQQHISHFGKSDLVNIISDFDMIIGSSGSEIIKSNIYNKLKKGVILISASSSDREFSAVDLRKRVPKIKDCHKDIFVDNIWLLNCGFPLNFNGNENSLSPEKIQITRALMFSAICLGAKKEYKNEFVELDVKLQKLILNKFTKLY